MKKIIFLFAFLVCFDVQAQESTSFSQLTKAPKAKVGTSIVPLMEQTLQADGSSGIAYENSVPAVNKDDIKTDENTKRYKKMRAVEREYTLPTNTFGSEIRNRINVVQNATFQTSTMPEVQEAVRKENIKFVECAENDETCQNYEVDEAGKVIWK
ncbi:MAG: hypothetical protein E7013_00060 [Alphaproteobacteria bacterium]|nr:hypothetical protein [Alphaproteobacteria bacterium]